MFDNYVGAKLAKRSKWVSIVIAISIAVLALVVTSQIGTLFPGEGAAA